jgi:hypothetical protein
MSKRTFINIFTKDLLDILKETFDIHHGVYLDPGTSLFETLDQISAESASIPIGNKCGTLAAQVEHIILYLNVLGKHIVGEDVGDVDWDEVWETVSKVNEAEWTSLKGKLRDSYAQITQRLENIQGWEENDAIGGSMAIIVHTAYHLGEIRQALCAL